jgi:ABC-type sugar transport system substrate-binding protein
VDQTLEETHMKLAPLTGRRACAAVATLALGSGLLAGCGSNDAKAEATVDGIEAKTIGYVDLIHSGAMQQRFYDYFAAGADAVGWEVQLQDAKGDPTRANTQAVSLINQGVDALVVSCADTAPMQPALQLAEQKGIPAVQVGCPMSNDDAWDASFPIDDEAVGLTLGKYVAEQIGAGAKVGILGDTTILSGQVRTDAINDGMSAADVEIVGNQSVSLTDPVGATRKTVSSYLTANPDLAAVFAVYDFFAPPAGDTVKSAGKGEDVGVYSFFADAVNVPYMRTPGSPLKAVADGPVEQVSLLAVDQLLGYFEADEPFDSAAGQDLEVNYEIFTLDNLPEASSDYLTPYPVEDYLPAYEEKWTDAYGGE